MQTRTDFLLAFLFWRGQKSQAILMCSNISACIKSSVSPRIVQYFTGSYSWSPYTKNFYVDIWEWKFCTVFQILNNLYCHLSSRWLEDKSLYSTTVFNTVKKATKEKKRKIPQTSNMLTYSIKYDFKIGLKRNGIFFFYFLLARRSSCLQSV